MRPSALACAVLAFAASIKSRPVCEGSCRAGAPYAPWAHHHWVWLSSDQSNQANVTAYVEEYASHNITVGAVDIDSEWANGVNDFVPNKAKFPDFKGMVDHLHAQSVRVILWATSMVDTDSSNYDAMVKGGYFVRNGFNSTEPDTLHWWHGDGLLLDYSNPEAVAWWNSQLDNVLDAGVDGFKTDGTDPFILEYLLPHGEAGVITYRDYADSYYGSFFNYSRSRNPDALIMSRPVDSYPVIGGVAAYLEFSPRYAVFSGWVGDQDPTFSGLRDAMGNMLHSAWRRYVGFGSDIGGYRTGPGPLGRTGELLLRWASVGAFCSLMENGGDKEHRPWKFDEPGSTFHTDAYRTLVAAHYELEQYLLTAGAQALERNTSIMRPVMPEPADPFGIIQDDNYTTYNYGLGPDYFVAPVVHENVTSLSVAFPEAAGGWVSVFDRTATYPGNATAVVPAPLGVIPAFRRAGALVPLHVSTPLVGNGDEASAGAITLLIHHPRCDGVPVAVELRGWRSPSAAASYTCAVEPASGRATLSLSVTPLARDVVLLLRGARATPRTGVAASSFSSACGVRRGTAHPILGPSAVPYAPAPQPLPPSRGAGASVPPLCASAAWSAHESVGADGAPATSRGLAELLVRRLPADDGLSLVVSGLAL